jgi:hypothetical protein
LLWLRARLLAVSLFPHLEHFHFPNRNTLPSLSNPSLPLILQGIGRYCTGEAAADRADGEDAEGSGGVAGTGSAVPYLPVSISVAPLLAWCGIERVP